MESVKGKSELEDEDYNKLTLEEREKREEEEALSQKQFEACFTAVDEDNNGTIDRGEMLHFIKLVSDIEGMLDEEDGSAEK